MRLTFEQFITKYCGKKVDYDKVYGAQCVDLFRQYCQDVLNIPHTGSVDGAKDLYEKYQELPVEQKYFVPLIRSAEPEFGYVAVWGSTPMNRYGHVALVLAKLNDSTLLVFEQDGYAQDGAKIVKRNLNNLLGYLRYTGA